MPFSIVSRISPRLDDADLSYLADILFDRMRGVRPAALGAPGGSRSNSPAQRSLSSAPAPQLAPVESAGPLKVQNGGYDDDEQEPPRRFQQRNESSKLSLPPIGEGSVVSEATDQPTAAAPRELQREQWEQQQQQRERQQQEEEQQRRQQQEQQARPWEQRQTQARPAQDVARSNGGTPDYLGGASGTSSRLDPAQGHDTERRLSSTGEHLDTYSAFLSSDLSREPTPPPPGANRSMATPPVLNSINTSSGSPPSPNYSRPTPLMHDNSAIAPTTASESAASATHISYNPAPSNFTGDRQHHEQPQPYYASDAAHSHGALASPGAPSTLAGTPVMERGGSDVGLAYLADDQAQQQHQQQQHAAPVETEPVVEKKIEAELTQVFHDSERPHSTERSAMEEPQVVEAIAAPSHEQLEEVQQQTSSAPSEVSAAPSARSVGNTNNQAHQGNVVDSPEKMDRPSPTDDSPYTTQPLFSPPKLHQDTFSNGHGEPVDSPNSAHTATLEGQQPTPNPGAHLGSPLIPPKSPGRERRPSPTIDTTALPGSSPRTQPQQLGQENLSPPIAAESSLSPQSDASSPPFESQARNGGHDEDHNIHSDVSWFLCG